METFLIAAPDQDRLRHLARAMPPVARAITPPDAKTPPEDDPAALLRGFAGWLMDVLPRAASSSSRLPTSACATSTSTTSTRRG